jgi:predicted TIM-barrel fold metal-dependent hydrolase
MCQDFGLPIILNQGIVGYRHTELDHAHPVLIDKVARSFPELRIIMGHLGHPWIDEAIAVLGKHPTIVADLALLYNRRWRFYHTMRLAMDYNVTGRLVFGSDLPFQAPHDAVDSFKSINEWAANERLQPIPDSVIDEIIYNRPLELVGL